MSKATLPETAPENTRFSVNEYRSPEQLTPFAHEWNSLLRQTAAANFFQTLTWLKVFWKHFARNRELRVLRILRQQSPNLPPEVIGFLPLMISDEKTQVGTLRRMGYPLDYWGTCYGPIGPEPRLCLAAGLHHLNHALDRTDLLDLKWTKPSQMRFVLEGCQDARRPVICRRQGRISAVRFSGGWEQYWSSRSSKLRNNVRRAAKRLRQLGSVEVQHVRADEPLRSSLVQASYEACESVAARSWQATSSSGNTLTDPIVQAFLRELHLEATQTGNTAIHLLKVDGRPIAFIYNYIFHGQIYGLRLGYDPAFSPYGPGALLFYHMIRDCFEREDHELDLGESHSGYKRHWETDFSTSYRLIHYRSGNWRAQVCRFRNWWQTSEHSDLQLPS